MDESPNRNLLRTYLALWTAAAFSAGVLVGLMVAPPPVVVVDADFPPAAEFLFRPAPYKVMHGGRFGIKSWSMGRALLVMGAQRPLRVACARETMKSLDESVHQLLSDQIKLLKLGSHYDVLKASIRGRNGTGFTFHGLREKSVHNIKSLEGADILWAEEAQNISAESWKTVLPTIRKPGSEIWVSFNPQFADDATYQTFIVHPPPGAVVVRTSWRDNPWLTEKNRREMEHMKATDLESYNNVYEGHLRSTVEGAIYAAEIARAENEGRITQVPYDPSRPVDTFWDLGYGDMVSIWFAQVVAMQHRFLDYYENTHQAIDFYLKILQGKEYTYGTCVLPWDGGAKQLGSGKSIEEIMRAKGFKVRVLPQQRVADGINAVRTMFPQCWFDSERCKDGLAGKDGRGGLRRYQYGPPSPDGVAKREPLHDAASHPADALRVAGMSLKPEVPKKTNLAQKPRPRLSPWS